MTDSGFGAAKLEQVFRIISKVAGGAWWLMEPISEVGCSGGCDTLEKINQFGIINLKSPVNLQIYPLGNRIHLSRIQWERIKSEYRSVLTVGVV